MISKGPKTKSGKGCFLRAKKGLWVDFHRIGGTHKSYRTAEFGLTTPSHLRETTIFRFWNFVWKLIIIASGEPFRELLGRKRGSGKIYQGGGQLLNFLEIARKSRMSFGNQVKLGKDTNLTIGP